MDFFFELSYFPFRKDGRPLFGKKKPDGLNFHPVSEKAENFSL